MPRLTRQGDAMTELDPKDVLVDLFGEELPLDDPEKMAEIVIRRLIDAGANTSLRAILSRPL